MAKRLPLPRREDLPEMVLFHRDHPADPTVILQVPNEARTDSETYIIDMERPGDVAWIDDLPFARDLRDKLSVAQHVAYSPRTGHLEEIEDLDQVSPVMMAFADARRMVPNRVSIMDRLSVHKRRRALPGASPLRRLLGGRG